MSEMAGMSGYGAHREVDAMAERGYGPLGSSHGEEGWGGTPTLPVRFDILEKHLAEQRELVEMLTARLDALLRPARTEPNVRSDGAEKAVMRTSSEVSERISRFASHVNSTNNTLRDVIDRLDV